MFRNFICSKIVSFMK